MSKNAQIPGTINFLYSTKNIGNFSDEMDFGNLMQLLENQSYCEELKKQFKLDDRNSEVLYIKGCKEISDNIISIDNDFKKLDLVVDVKNITIRKFTEEGQVLLDIANITDAYLNKLKNSDMVEVESCYSTRADFLNELYSIDKFATFCISKEEYKPIIDHTLKSLKNSTIDFPKKKLRLLIDSNGKIYLRAITSVDSYKDYGLRISLFLGTLALHDLMINNNESFELRSFIYTESELRVVFKSKKKYNLSEKYSLSYAIEITNNEIKRGAIKINILYSLDIGDETILLNSKEIPKNLVSISHQKGLVKVIADFENLHEKIQSEFNERKSEFEKCILLSNPNELKEYIVSKISDKKRSKFNKKYSDLITNELSEKISSLHELAIKLNKIELLFPPEEEESMDYWRFTIYKAIMKK